MRKHAPIFVIVALAFLAGRVSKQSPAIAQIGIGGEAPPPCQDVNRDGVSDISDAVYLLNWLFVGGSEPSCEPGDWCCLPCPPGALPDTGQTRCYNAEGTEVTCDGDTLPGQDGLYETGCHTEGRFVDNQDGTVTDNCTGLMWQQATGNDGTLLAWSEAIVDCENLELAGHDDWRLPNVRELQSLVDYGRHYPAIDPVFGALSTWYWASTSLDADPGEAWLVAFSYGSVIYGTVGKDTTVHAVRAVRTIQSSE